MTKRYLTEAEAWHKIARAYETNKVTEIYQRGDLTWAGLCYAVYHLAGEERISKATESGMNKRLYSTFQPKGVSREVHWWSGGRENWEARAFACYLLALLAEEDK